MGSSGICEHRNSYPVFAQFEQKLSLRKHAYSNTLKISPLKTESFQLKILIFFHISAHNIDCGYSLEPPRRGSSNEYPQSVFLRSNKKNNVYPCKPQFYYIKVGLRGSKLYRYVFVMSFCSQNPRMLHNKLVVMCYCRIHRMILDIRICAKDAFSKGMAYFAGCMRIFVQVFVLHVFI